MKFSGKSNFVFNPAFYQHELKSLVKMRNIQLFSLAFSIMLIFSSCSEDDAAGDQGTDVDLDATAQSSDDHINTASLPQAILDYITSNYPDNTVFKAEIEDSNNFEVELNNEIELIFDQEGNFLGIDDDNDDNFGDEDLAPEDLPASIRDFVTTYFSDASIAEAERENNGNYEIELSNDVELIFDAAGKFLGRADDNGNDDSEDDDIAVSDLPQVILDYITTNYPDNSIIEAEREDDNGFEVTLDNGIELEFDSEGNFLEAEDHNGDDDDEDDEDDENDD